MTTQNKGTALVTGASSGSRVVYADPQLGLLVFIAIPLAPRMVSRDVVYGFRTRATLSDDAIWYEANAHFGRYLLVASLCGALAPYP
jgi:SdpI/YfhL protein family